MSVVRLIYVSFPAELAEQAEKNWKEECAPLMIKQPGCLSEQLLRCLDRPGEYISYSEWDNDDSIRQYLNSADHQEIKRRNRNITGAKVEVKRYEPVS
jgi:heme-degrading monooxygenase HmoA